MASVTTALDLDGLRSCVSGEVVGPDEPGYDGARSAWNLLVDQRPAAVVIPRAAADIAQAVRAAGEAGLHVLAQGTGHNAPPCGDLSGTLLVRTSAMRDVTVDPVARVARAEAGALWDDVVGPAAEHGLAALHGSSPTVGVVGYTLGGGLGWLARRHGLACNAVRAIELVSAGGVPVRVDADHDPELFWALRGGGGSFGVVTAIEFALLPVSEIYAGWLVWPLGEAERVLTAWSAWTQTVPDTLTSIGRLLRVPPLPEIPEPLRGRELTVVEVAFLGERAEGEDLLRSLRALGPELDTVASVPAPALARMHQDPEGPAPGIGAHALLDALPPEAVGALLEAAGPGSDSSLLSVEVRQLGGALAAPAPGGGALSHLDGAFLLFGVGLPMGPGAAGRIAADAERLVAALAPWGRGRSYLSFAERPTDTRTAFGADAHRRLVALRSRIDPRGVCRANHTIHTIGEVG